MNKTFKQAMKDSYNWNKQVVNQLARYNSECGLCECRKLSEDEMKKYVDKTNKCML